VVLGAVACGGEAAEPPQPRGFGHVSVATIVDLGGPGTDVTTIDATFLHAETRSECQIANHGACQVMDCVQSTQARPDVIRLMGVYWAYAASSLVVYGPEFKNVYSNSETSPVLGTYLVRATIPIPAAVWLFGSALGVMGWMRRKAAP
jgi:hypothetical protein